MSEHLYIHIPFCLKKCRYCDFYSLGDLDRIPDFIRALNLEIRLRPSDPADRVRTVYFGGGTPSLLTLDDLASVLDTIAGTHSLADHPEITLEANPGTIDLAYLRGLKSLGVNRLSLGIQSFDDGKLNRLGRIHNAAQAVAAPKMARDAEFDNIGLDLIYGLPGESETFWTKELDAALAFAPEHLSCYMLTTEPGTPLHDQVLAGEFMPMPPEEQVGIFLATSAYLTKRGWHHYEISNFARGNRWYSRHNSAYWQMKPYAGFGPSAHSMNRPQNQSMKPSGRGSSGQMTRSWNTADLDRYVTLLVDKEQLLVEEEETLSLEQQMLELVMVGLRTRAGIDVAAFDRLSETPFRERFSGLIRTLGDEGFVREDGTGKSFALSRAGWARLDSIVEGFAALIV